MVPDAVRLLCLEDSAADAALIRHQADQCPFPCAITVVDSSEAFLRALAAPAPWDILISDWRIPGYSGSQALLDARRYGCQAPFLVVSGTIGADEAVAALKDGVADYILKDRLERLPTALRRCLDDIQARNDWMVAQRRLEASEQRFRLLTETTQDLILLCDREDRILYVNPTAQRLLGRTLDDGAATPVSTFLPADCEAWFRQHLTLVWDTAGPREGEMGMALADGQRWFDVRSVPFRVNGQTATAVLTVARDITVRKRLEETLRSATATAQSASIAKSQFLAVMSHELRTPLNGLLGMTSLLTAAELEPRIHEMAALAHRAGQDLLQIIGSILDFSNLDTGKVHLEKKAFNLHQMAAEVVEHFRPHAREKSLALELAVDDLVPALVEGDILHLRQILSSLLGNAIKFTDSGHVQVRVAAGTDLGPTVRLRLAVTDTGIGIAPEDQRRLFKPFSQLDSTLTRRHGGCGIGLVVTRRLIEMMGGSLEIESSHGMGSCFTAVIPLARVARSESAGPASPPRLHPPRVLVVDDDAVNRLVIERLLQAGGCQVSLAQDGREALLACRAGGLDLVLMDIQMPHMDGWEAAIAIRSEERGRRRVPIVAVTAYVTDEARGRCRAAGIDDFLPKPIDIRTLMDVVATHTGWSQT